MKNTKTKKAIYWILDLALNVVVIFGIVIIIQTWIVAPFDVSGKSMCDTLNIINGECVNDYGEKIIINEVLYLFKEPQRGEIVVFKIPHENKSEEKYFIKRIIGVAGDKIKIENGEVFIQTKNSSEFIKLEEPYLNQYNKSNTKVYFEYNTEWEVPEDHYFLLGDNRNYSTDSRTCFDGTQTMSCKTDKNRAFVHKDIIRGKASIVWWPFKNMRTIKTTEYSELDN